MSSLWLGPKSFIRVVGRSRSPVTRGAPAKEENLHEHLAKFPFSNPGAGELRDYLRLRHPPAAGSNSSMNWRAAEAWLHGQIDRLLGAVAAKRETRRAIRELAAFSDRELRDVGLTRTEIERVASQRVSTRSPRAWKRSAGSAS